MWGSYSGEETLNHTAYNLGLRLHDLGPLHTAGRSHQSETIPVRGLSPIILLPALIPSADLITRIPAPSPKPEQREFKHRGLNI